MLEIAGHRLRRVGLTRGDMAVLSNREKSAQRPDCVADEPVSGEPVSASQFPANREFNREFFKFGPFSAILAPNQRANSNACGKIP
jgi:hypothetical protein